MKAAEALTWRALYDNLFATLVAAQAERNRRQEWSAGELGWVTHERQVMTDRTNLLRSRRGLGPVSMDDVARKEQMASGHIDYTTKFAIGCADLVVDEHVISPGTDTP